MSPDINLAVKTVAKIRQKQKLKRLVNQALIWVGLFLSLALILVSALSLWVNHQNQLLETRIKTAQKGIEALEKIEGQQVYLTSKLAVFGGMVKTHELHQAVAETVFSLIPSGTSLKGFEVNDSGTIALSGFSPDWPLFSRLLVNLRQKETKPLLVKSVKVNQVNFNSDGAITFDLDLAINL